MKRIILISCILIALGTTLLAQSTKVLPTKSQLAWANSEIGVLIHYDINIFEPSYNFRADWNYHPSLSLFNPKELDTDQWIRAAKAAGAKYAVLVAKHCSGFSLWPTNAHDYSVKNTPWKNGKGDIVRDFVNSCKKYGLKPGIYASTTANGYLKVDNPGKVVSGDPQEQKRYNSIVETQLTELWSNYGNLLEIWFDGGILPPSKGGFDVLSLLKKHQPNAVAFQGPFSFNNNIRWVGNEAGVAPYPCWATADSTTSASGVIEIKGLHGNPDGKFWCPGEADFPLRWNSSFSGGWFWKEGEDNKMFSINELIEKYYKSIGRNANMLIGVVVDNRGLVPDADVERLSEFGEKIKLREKALVGSIKGKGNTLILKLKDVMDINQIQIEEDVARGEHIRSYEIEVLADGNWKKVCEGTSVGHKRIQLFDKIMVSSVRLTIKKYEDKPIIKKFSAYLY